MDKKESRRPVRLWGAILTDDGPAAEVRDISSLAEMLAALADPAFRMWGWCDVAYVSRKGHSRGPCLPGKPCAKCQAKALTWWWEHGRRTKARYWTAAKAEARTRMAAGVWAAADWGKRRDSLAEALRDANEAGWALVNHSDGHRATLDWIEVTCG